MPLFHTSGRRSFKYERLTHSPDVEAFDANKSHGPGQRRLWKTATIVLGCLGISCSAVLLLMISLPDGMSKINDNPHGLQRQDSVPAARREWRSLAQKEKLEYISAVQCLRHKPSRIGLNQSLYDDFPWVHSQIGNYVHGTAAFLPWHRYFISTYESTLQNECGYAGQLPYWDWTLDWEFPTNAPVWDTTLGFGGTGTTQKSNYTLLDGHCVTTGPFANLTVLYIKGKSSEHCLTRGFLDQGSTKMHELKQWIHPNTILSVLNNSDYATFNLQLEDTSHISIPRIIRGDFSLVTAPYDPVFFLHHAQLDRIWYTWQQLTTGRMREYKGFTTRNGTTRASPRDLLLMGGLAPDIHIQDVLDPRGSKLYYMYI